MFQLLVRLFLLSFIILGVAHAIPGIEVKSYAAAVLFCLVLGLMNTLLRPFLLILSLPITMLTLGLFAFLVNALTFWLASLLSFGVQITTFGGALFGGGIVWLASIFINQGIWIHYTKE